MIAAVLLLTLVFATQTRQLIVLCLAFTLFCLRAKAIIWAASLSILLSPFYFYPSLLEILGSTSSSTTAPWKAWKTAPVRSPSP